MASASPKSPVLQGFSRMSYSKAETFEMDRDDLKRRRAQSVRNVKATNGTISLEKYARFRQEQDWDDDEWQD